MLQTCSWDQKSYWNTLFFDCVGIFWRRNLSIFTCGFLVWNQGDLSATLAPRELSYCDDENFRYIFAVFCKVPQVGFANRRLYSSSTVFPDGQIRYSTNKKWHAAMNFIPKPRDIPSYQYPVILLSAFVCLVYFCFLREENSLDDILAGKITLKDIEEGSVSRPSS